MVARLLDISSNFLLDMDGSEDTVPKLTRTRVNADFATLPYHPWSRQHLGLEIDADEQTILKYILEYVLNCSSQMKSKSMWLFSNKSMI